jgi:exosortase
MLKVDVTGRQRTADVPFTEAPGPVPLGIWVSLTILVLAGAWSYAPILSRLVGVWLRVPDYSHGFLVIPVAIVLLAARRHHLPAWEMTGTSIWSGLALIVAAEAVRLAGSVWYSKSLEEWSLVGWVAGVLLLLAGWRIFWWGLPAVLFLLFMIPLPWRLESALSFPLQTVATHVSVWLFQFLGQPAIAQGHVVRIGETTLEVAQACSGLRMFMSIAAIGAAFVILFQRSLGHRVLLLAALAPIAILANSLRIVATGLLSRWVSSDAGHSFAHDFSGWVMIPVATGMFLAWNWYLDNLFLAAVAAPLPHHDARNPSAAGI